MTFRISGQEIKILCKTKYLGITFDEHLTFKYHLKMIDSHLMCGCQIWEQKQSPTVETIEQTKNNALQILNFKGPPEESDYLYKESKINKLKNIIIANCQFVYD